MMRGTLVLLALCLILPLTLGAANDPVFYVFPVTRECDPALRADGDIVLYLRQAHNSVRLALNAEEITVPKLADRLRDIYRVRNGSRYDAHQGTSLSKELQAVQEDIWHFHVVFLDADPKLSVRAVATVLRIVRESVPAVRVVVITPTAKGDCQKKWDSRSPAA